MEKARAFAEAHRGTLGEVLGFGIHGIAFVLQSEEENGQTALKIHTARGPYLRERDVYERLRECGISKILHCHVPHLFRCDDRFFALEMTIVSPPFVLDFAGAWLDFPPEFSEEVWQEQTRKWAEEFQSDWPRAQAVLAELEELHIHMLDPSPSNIRFR